MLLGARKLIGNEIADIVSAGSETSWFHFDQQGSL